MAKKSMIIAFANGGLLAATAMGTKKDVPVAPLEPVEVPEAYGRHLVDDRFAYEVEQAAEKPSRESGRSGKPKPMPAPVPAAGSSDAGNAGASGDGASSAGDESNGQSTPIEDAEAELLAARTALAEAGDDLVAKAAAESRIADAEKALEDLKV